MFLKFLITFFKRINLLTCTVTHLNVLNDLILLKMAGNILKNSQVYYFYIRTCIKIIFESAVCDILYMTCI